MAKTLVKLFSDDPNPFSRRTLSCLQTCSGVVSLFGKAVFSHGGFLTFPTIRLFRYQTFSDFSHNWQWNRLQNDLLSYLCPARLNFAFNGFFSIIREYNSGELKEKILWIRKEFWSSLKRMPD